MSALGHRWRRTEEYCRYYSPRLARLCHGIVRGGQSYRAAHNALLIQEYFARMLPSEKLRSGGFVPPANERGADHKIARRNAERNTSISSRLPIVTRM